MDDDALLQVPEQQRREPSRSADVHPVRKACLAAAVKLVSLTPTRIVGEPDMADARGLIDDLDAICTIVDPVVAAIGSYAEAHFGRLDQSLFTDQLHGALDGNATFEIEQAARKLLADRADNVVEMTHAFRRA